MRWKASRLIPEPLPYRLMLLEPYAVEFRYEIGDLLDSAAKAGRALPHCESMCLLGCWPSKANAERIASNSRAVLKTSGMPNPARIKSPRSDQASRALAPLPSNQSLRRPPISDSTARKILIASR